MSIESNSSNRFDYCLLLFKKRQISNELGNDFRFVLVNYNLSVFQLIVIK